MKRLMLFVVVVCLAVPAFAREKFKPASDKGVPNQYVVVLDESITDVPEIANFLARANGGETGRIFTRALKGFVVRMSESQARRLAESPLVDYVEQDFTVSVNVTQTGAPWGLDRIDQRDRPLNTTFNYTATGAGVTAYIIDTGIRATHSELIGRVVQGYDAVDNALPADDCNGHGTHVAGTVGGTTYGVAKGVTLVAVRVLDCGGSGTNAGVIAGVDWVTGNHLPGQPAVANMSLGGGASAALDTAVQNSIADGVTYGVAAGNGLFGVFAQNACSGSPSRVPEAITVSATDNADKKPSWANIGSCVDLFAPGINITSSWYTSDTATNTISGTSMATPHVVGVAAQYLQLNPTATPLAVRDAIVNNASVNKVVSPGSGSPNRLLFTNY